MSPMLLRSLTMRAYSAAGMVTVALYSVSGMPRCSLSMSISLSSKSDTRSSSAGTGGVGCVRGGSESVCKGFGRLRAAPRL